MEALKSAFDQLKMSKIPTSTTQNPLKDNSETMYALEWQSARNVQVKEKPIPKITEPKDAIIKVTCTTICGSDLHLYHNSVPEMKAGDILGHECVGVVVDVGSDVQFLKPGQRVAVSAVIADGTCEYCQKGMFSCCDTTNPSTTMERMYGHRTAGLFGYSHMTGGYDGSQAEFLRVPFADVNCLPLPDDFSDENALLLSDVACTGWHACELAEVNPQDVVAVWGCGPIGLHALMFAKYRGARRLIAIDRIPERLNLAKKAIGAETINYDNENVTETLKRLVPGGVDKAIEAAGFRYAKSLTHRIEKAVMMETDSIDALNEAIISVKKGGIVALIGDFVGYANHFPIGATMEKSLTLRGGQLFVQKYWKDLMEIIRTGQVDPTFIYTHKMNLEDAKEAYELFDSKNDGVIKILLQTRFGRQQQKMTKESEPELMGKMETPSVQEQQSSMTDPLLKQGKLPASEAVPSDFAPPTAEPSQMGKGDSSFLQK